MSTHRGYDEMPLQIQESVDAYKRVHGQNVPLNGSEAKSMCAGTSTDHPYESMMDKAELEVINFLDDPNDSERYVQTINRNIVDNPDIVTDGGYEFEHMKVYAQANTQKDTIAQKASVYENVGVYSFGDEGVAIAGDRGEVNEFVGCVRQQLGADKTEHFFNKSMHDRVPEPKNGEITNTNQDKNFKTESAREAAADGGRPQIPGTSMGGEESITSYDDSDPEGKMGM